MSQPMPIRIQPRLKSAPKVRQLYWCDFPKDAQLPEFWKRRPVVVISYKNTLYGAVTIIPCTTSPPKDDDPYSKKWAFPLHTTIDNKKGWAICDKPTTVAVSRLLPNRTGTKRMPNDEFNNLLSLVLEWLPQLNS